jgi:hypothetical protein
MAGDVLNINVYSPLKLHSGLKGKRPTNCHYSYNLQLQVIKKKTQYEKNLFSSFLTDTG